MSLIDDSLAIMMKSGGGGFTQTILYDSGSFTTFAPIATDIQLSDNLSNYDEISIVVTSQNDAPQNLYLEGFSTTDYLLSENAYLSYGPYGTRYIHISFTDTTFNILRHNSGNEPSGYTPELVRIYGYKWS